MEKLIPRTQTLVGVVGSMDGDMGMAEGEDEDVGGGEDEDVGGGGGVGGGVGEGGGGGVGEGAGGERTSAPEWEGMCWDFWTAFTG